MADSNLEYSREMDSVIEDNYVYDSKTKSWTKREAGVLRRRAEGYRQSIDAFVKDAVTSDDGELSAKGTELFFGGRCDKVQSALQQLPAGSRLFGGGNADGFWSTKGERSSTKHEARQWPEPSSDGRRSERKWGKREQLQRNTHRRTHSMQLSPPFSPRFSALAGLTLLAATAVSAAPDVVSAITIQGIQGESRGVSASQRRCGCARRRRTRRR